MNETAKQALVLAFDHARDAEREARGRMEREQARAEQGVQAYKVAKREMNELREALAEHGIPEPGERERSINLLAGSQGVSQSALATQQGVANALGGRPTRN